MRGSGKRIAALRRRTRPADAFTLVELLITLIVIAILSAIAVPRFGNFTARQRVAAAGKRLTLDLVHAQRQARHLGKAQTVLFSTQANTYELIALASADRSTRAYQVDVGADPYNARLTSVDLGGGKQVTFNIYGLPDVSGKITLTAGGFEHVVEIDADAGRVFEP